jgi:hypothetical protein
MNLRSLLLSVFVVTVLFGAIHASRLSTLIFGESFLDTAKQPAGLQMVSSAEKLLEGLSKDQKTKAALAFDDKDRTNWHFVPYQENKKSLRKGLPLQDMTAAQKDAAMALLRAGTSADGYTKATTIMSLESILRELEKNGANVRDPEWYFFTVFGTPAKTGKWGWRVEGHHLSLNFVIDDGKIVASTPAFFGANPALLKQGDKKGQRTLSEAEDFARDLFKSLDDGQKKIAFQEKQFGEIEEGKAKPNVGEAKGLSADKMTDAQRKTLQKLIQSYANRMPPEIADVEMKQVEDAGLDKVHFAFAGGVEEGDKHTYRIQGPTFVVEFLNVQEDSAKNPANHIHSSWRNIKGDFGTASP